MSWEQVVEELKKIGGRKIFVQFAEGLKPRIQEVYEKLEQEGFEPVLCLEETFGACDLREEEALRIGCDTILHLAHTDFGLKSKLPVVYHDWLLEANPSPILEKEWAKLEKFERICLVTSLQFVSSLQKTKQWLEAKGKKVLVPKLEKHEGQILGCRVERLKELEKDFDALVCVGAGKFHALGASLEVSKPCFLLDLEKAELADLSEEKLRILKILEWNKSSFESASQVGILLSWKKGQVFSQAFELKQRLEARGKKVFLLAMDEISPEKLEGLKLDFLICCACPRLALDDLQRFKIPMLSAKQVEEILSK